jgi:aminocarboxymuconate-semialdehyde decarboxylase
MVAESGAGQLARLTHRPAPVVDCHAHYIPESVIETIRARQRFPGIEVQQGADGLRFAFPGLTLSPPAPVGISRLENFSAWMDQKGIDIQVLSPWTDLLGYTLDEEDAREWVGFLNDSLLEEVSGSNRFVTLAGIPLPHPGAAVAEIRRARSAGHVGIVIGTALPGADLDDPRLEQVWDELARARMPVLLHPIFLAREPRLQQHGLANAIGRAHETTIALSRLLLSGVLARHPGLRLIAAHGAGTLPFLLRRLQRAHELSPDTSPPTEGFRQLYVDSVVLDPRVFTALLTITDASRVLLGSDYPFPWEPDPVRLIGLVPTALQARGAILGGTACELFGLHASATRAGPRNQPGAKEA